ncbi:MAG: hypothetical protein V2I36_12105 [Desulfopila sp.]|nr:hypothetical protein [Desulfopila sp.]
MANNRVIFLLELNIIEKILFIQGRIALFKHIEKAESEATRGGFVF